MERYFAAANTEKGFVGWFENIFDSRTLERIYIIKGGCGTGKSTFMKKAAERAVKKGAHCLYIYCSSDPDSLDGILLTLADGRRLGIIDGTAPHMQDPKYPAAVDSILNFGEFLCEDLLAANREGIIKLSSEKSEFYKKGYKALASAGVISTALLNEADNYLLGDKLMAAVRRLLFHRMKDKGVKPHKVHERLLGLTALSSKGEVYFDSYSDSDIMFAVSDMAGTAPYLFDALIKAAHELGLPYDRAPVPLIPAMTEAIRFPTLGVSVVTHTDREDVHPINMYRFVDRDKLSRVNRQGRKTLQKCQRELTNAALESFRNAGKIHAELEKIYIGAMDFTRLNEASERYFARMGI